jgi:hypothetical protein
MAGASQFRNIRGARELSEEGLTERFRSSRKVVISVTSVLHFKLGHYRFFFCLRGIRGED